MSEITAIIEKARQRGQQKQLPYAGELTPPEAAVLMQASGYVLVDVRSEAEWQFVGVPDNAVMIEYKMFPGMTVNPDFVTHLHASVPSGSVVMLLCRSGARSHDAAILAQQSGYTAFNILEGFEGELDDHSHRGRISGWKKHNLPWRQG